MLDLLDLVQLEDLRNPALTVDEPALGADFNDLLLEGI
jgi:hypothetical protein